MGTWLFYEHGRRTRPGTASSGKISPFCFFVGSNANIVARYTTKAFGPVVAKAATLTIVEAENIVPIGSINPNDVDLPGIFVDRIVPATEDKNIEIKKLRPSNGQNSASSKDSSMVQRNRIARRAAKELKQGYYVNLGVGEYIAQLDALIKRN